MAGDLTINGCDLYLTGQGSSASTTEGPIYYDTDDDNLYVYTSGGWIDLTQQDTAGGVSNYWNLANQGLAPINETLDLYVGGVATASATITLQANTGNRYLTGNLGLGTQAPAFDLDVRGNASISGTLGFGPKLNVDIPSCNAATEGTDQKT